MYNKRIAFLMSYQHLIPHGGIGQFALSFVRLMKENNVKVDIVTDKFDKPTEFTKTLINEGARFIYTDNPLPYTKHQGIFMYGDSYCIKDSTGLSSGFATNSGRIAGKNALIFLGK